ncbi:DEAD/DEAH box helicase [Sporolactobacillus inulinus]|uniref:DEAd-box ATP-dependent RNA helicase CshA n=2 Tax=Sporolactobacillus inulinus TaxID=2078 RepID=A0A4Y1Z9M0_9BACL|nr:DEAD/DEAH box helicase [Sporolactobacillus inulinus]KLI01696.1 DEAD/DEAH box helicase [Sporolactobacillus inulinus CASD]GAY75739.1 DEAd-box ATP-dependent RNA helicase CshA [Sporolactobacillus inulinus]GEB76014.1 ATP-dependent RNA helicase CshA [Sporolactobacillus inulinus]
MKFSELEISQEVKKATDRMGFTDMTPIQEQAIPVAETGVDLIGQAQTGTGKTTAFGIPMIEAADPHNSDIQGVVITPTRELAIQNAQELNALGFYKKVRTVAIYGGQDIQRQIRDLKRRPSIISATPGRLLDHIKRRTIRLDQIKVVVLDEADEMLNMGFIEDIHAILEATPENRQTLLFSATMPRPIQVLAEKFMHEPKKIQIKAKTLTTSLIDQSYVKVRELEKFDALTRFLDIQSPERAIVFGRTKRRVDELMRALQKRGYEAEGIHGDLTQSKRDLVLRRFKQNEVKLLVATDVAARGLDISNVTHVYNFDLPQDPESYVHRIGRTGRAGKTGMALTFITPSEFPHLRSIERLTKQPMKQLNAPSYEEALAGQQKIAIDNLKEMIESGKYRSYAAKAQDLLDEFDATDVLAAALKLITKEPDTTPVRLTREQPLMVKRSNRQQRGGGRGRNNYRSHDRDRRNNNYRGRSKQKSQHY